MVLGWKYLHSMQRFWGHFGGIVNFGNFAKMVPKPLHGMGFLGVLVIFGKMAKTRCVSDSQELVIVRHAASFGHFVKK